MSSGTITRPNPMTPDPGQQRDRIDLRVDPDIRARIDKQSQRFNQAISAYIRQAIIERLERDEATDPADAD